MHNQFKINSVHYQILTYSLIANHFVKIKKGYASSLSYSLRLWE